MASIDNVLDVTPRVQYTASAAQAAFDYPFSIFSDADLVVDIDGVTKTLTTDYTVSGAGDDTGGTVTLVTPATGGEIVTIWRDVSIARTTDFQQNGPRSSSSFNDEFDRLTVVAQDLENKIGRAIRFPQNSLSTNAQAEMAPIETFFGKLLRISATGILEAATVSDSVVTLTASVIGALLYPQTQAEINAGVTPINYQYEPGDAHRFGLGTASTDSGRRTAIQNAIDSSNDVFIRAGDWTIDSALQWNGYNHIRGESVTRTAVKLGEAADEDANVLEPKLKDGSPTNWSISDMTLDGNYDRPTVSGVGTDRPAASCIATMGAKEGVIRRVFAKDAVLHGIDICNGGEVESSQRYYVAPANQSASYYPSNYSERIRVIDCSADNCGDDAITCHFSQHIWIERCVARNASHRHPTVGACNGIELDDGHRDVWVVDCLAHNVTRGFASKTHPPLATGERVYFINCKATQCNQGFYIHKSGTSTVGNDVVLINPTVWNPAEEVAQTSVELVGINVVNVPNVHIINPIIHAPDGTSLALDQAIWVNTSTGRCFIRGGEIRHWPDAESSDSVNAAIYATSTTGELIVEGAQIRNCGWKGIVCTHTTSGKIHIRNVDLIGESISNSQAVRITGELGGGIDLAVTGVTATGFDHTTSYGTLDSVEGLMVEQSPTTVLASSSETATGTFTASPHIPITDLDSSGGAVTCTCPDGTVDGQRKKFTMSDASSSSTVSVTSHLTSDPEVFTFAQTTDVLILEWVAALAQWRTVFNNGVAT